MQEISESHTASSWPDGYEKRIQDWVDAGDASAAPPFDDRYGIVTPDFFNRLRELRRRCGGWLYWSDDLRRIAFAPEPEWQRVRAAQEAAEAKSRREWQESQARTERLMRRLPEVMSAARSDPAFWAALRAWELRRETKRPAQLPPPPQLAGPLAIRRITAKTSPMSEDPPLDPIFAEFVARVRVPDDVLTARDIVLNLRAEMRRELGLDGTIGWPGGPGLGNE